MTPNRIPRRRQKRMGLLASGLLLACGWVVGSAGGSASAATPTDFLQQWRSQGAGASGFSAQRGQQLFNTRVTDWSCSSCHTADPRRAGQHASTSRAIQPMAPAVNPARFTDTAKVEKWFRRNCRDVLARECTAQEKGDVLTWLVSLR